MKCPSCNADIALGKICKSCGRKIEHLGNIEVTYNEYKISELLEIKHKRYEQPAKSAQIKAGEAPAVIKKAVGLPAEVKGIHKMSRPMWGAIYAIFVLAAGAFAFYMLK